MFFLDPRDQNSVRICWSHKSAHFVQPDPVTQAQSLRVGLKNNKEGGETLHGTDQCLAQHVWGDDASVQECLEPSARGIWSEQKSVLRGRFSVIFLPGDG